MLTPAWTLDRWLSHLAAGESMAAMAPEVSPDSWMGLLVLECACLHFACRLDTARKRGG
jgi:hypothetical protein